MPSLDEQLLLTAATAFRSRALESALELIEVVSRLESAGASDRGGVRPDIDLRAGGDHVLCRLHEGSRDGFVDIVLAAIGADFGWHVPEHQGRTVALQLLVYRNHDRLLVHGI